ncbi:MAG: hypothetical protein KGJ59_14160 [Bacteroidota bacterium]|nr:hypothetical protein [Bacteroidota bacterium]
MKTFPILLTGLLLVSCSPYPTEHNAHDNQFIQIFYHSGLYDEFDTFHGTYQKDLIPGIAKTTMWLTAREQGIILDKVERSKFFSLPDTIYPELNAHQFPDMGPQVLRVKYRDQDKTVVWYFPLDARNIATHLIESLQSLLDDIIASKPEYKALPPRKGGYQ